MPDSELSVRFDVSQIEELATDQKTVAERAVMLLNAGIVTVNEARQILGMAEIEQADTPAEAAEDQAEGETGQPEMPDMVDDPESTDTEMVVE